MLRIAFLLLCLVVLLISDTILWLRVWRQPRGQSRTLQLIGAVCVLIALVAAGFTFLLVLKEGS
jgi:hypothetical protein